MCSLYPVRRGHSDHGSVSGRAQVLQKASELPQRPSPTCPTELDVHTISALPVLSSCSSLLPATSCNIYKSQRARWLVFESSSELTSPHNSGEHWSFRRAFPTLPLHQQSWSSTSPGRLNMCTKLGWGSRSALARTSDPSTAQRKG